jgi:hypothetical protein
VQCFDAHLQLILLVRRFSYRASLGMRTVFLLGSYFLSNTYLRLDSFFVSDTGIQGSRISRLHAFQKVRDGLQRNIIQVKARLDA